MVPQKKGELKKFDVDEHPRPETTLDALARLRPVVKPNGTVTAGNASGINDGACAVLLASEDSSAEIWPDAASSRDRIGSGGHCTSHHGIRACAGDAQDSGEDRASALRDIDVIELNEAFASQSLAVLRDLGLPDDAEHVNPTGGAIAIGHPLGASGARLITTAVYQLQDGQARYALCTMCIGVGQGIAMILERC